MRLIDEQDDRLRRSFHCVDDTVQAPLELALHPGAGLSPAGENAIIQNKLLGGRTPVTLGNIFDGDTWDFSGKYGVAIDADERIPLANDILSGLSGRPMDVRGMTDAEVQDILANAKSEEKQEAKPVADTGSVRITGAKSECDDICKYACECMEERGGGTDLHRMHG